MFIWVNSLRLNEFMDAYFASYKPKHRYFTGLLLVVRSIMFLTLGFNPHTDLGIDLILLTALVPYQNSIITQRGFCDSHWNFLSIIIIYATSLNQLLYCLY